MGWEWEEEGRNPATRFFDSFLLRCAQECPDNGPDAEERPVQAKDGGGRNGNGSKALSMREDNEGVDGEDTGRGSGNGGVVVSFSAVAYNCVSC